MKLLIAVKSAVIAKLLASSLSAYDVHICDTGRAALEMIETLQPDILILELALPGMDGLTVLRKAKYRPRVILALTNLATPAVVQAAADAGVQDVILIPCKISHIVQHLNALTEKAPSPEG